MDYKEVYFKNKTDYVSLNINDNDIMEGGAKNKCQIDSLIKTVQDNFNKQIKNTKKELCLKDDNKRIDELRSAFKDSIDMITKNKGKIDPCVKIVTKQGQKEVVNNKRSRIGYFPVAADPFHWAHLLTALQVLARYKLDKVVFIIGGEDPRKPNLTNKKIRWPMADDSVEIFGDFFEISDITSIGDNYKNDGETNIIRDLERNTKNKIDAYYMVGSDHFNWEDGGKPDTVQKLAINRKKYKIDKKHDIAAIFIARDPKEITKDKIDEMKKKLKDNKYKIKIIVPAITFSSTEIRNTLNRSPLVMIPHTTYKTIMKEKLYGLKCFD